MTGSDFGRRQTPTPRPSARWFLLFFASTGSRDPGATDADLSDLESSYHGPGGAFEVLINGSGEVVGTVGLCPLGDGRCELRKMYLAADCRGRGLGKRLLQHAIGRARELGF